MRTICRNPERTLLIATWDAIKRGVVFGGRSTSVGQSIARGFRQANVAIVATAADQSVAFCPFPTRARRVDERREARILEYETGDNTHICHQAIRCPYIRECRSLLRFNISLADNYEKY